MSSVHRFTILPIAALLVILGLTSCQSGAKQAPADEGVSQSETAQAPEAAPVETEGAPAAEAPETAAPSAPIPPRRAPESPRPAEKPALPTPVPKPEASPESAPASRPSSPAEPAPPSPPPEPRIIEVTIPEGTVLELEMLTALDTAVNRVGDEIQARTLSPVYVQGESVLPKGSYVEGRVTEVEASGRVKGRARLGFTFDRLSTRTGLKEIRTSYVDQEAGSGKKKDAAVVGGGAGLGAIVGGIIGGKKGAAIGAAIGGAGGTGVVLATKGEEIRIPVGAEVNVRLDGPVTIQVN